MYKDTVSMGYWPTHMDYLQGSAAPSSPDKWDFSSKTQNQRKLNITAREWRDNYGLLHSPSLGIDVTQWNIQISYDHRSYERNWSIAWHPKGEL